MSGFGVNPGRAECGHGNDPVVVSPESLSSARLRPINTIFNMDKVSKSKTAGRVLSAFVLIALPIISASGQIPRSPNSHPELQQITFSPQLTPVNFTITPQSTAIAPLGAQVLAPTEAGSEESGDELDISGEGTGSSDTTLYKRLTDPSGTSGLMAK